MIRVWFDCLGHGAQVTPQAATPQCRSLRAPRDQTAVPMPATLLITRPRGRAERFARDCRRLIGHEIPFLIAPVVRTIAQPVAADLTAYRGLIVTSEAGLNAIDWPAAAPRPVVYAVGSHTAKLARAAEFDAIDGGGDADALVATIIAASPKGPLLHLHGSETRGDIRARLTDAGLHVEACVAYRQQDVELDGATIALLRGSAPVVLPVFSVRSALRLLKYQPAPTHHIVAISDAVARAWPRDTNPIHVAECPTAISMAQSVAALYEED
ncbi:MAG: uroporphyrinogen-III synthase [Rhodobacteraceae bacterium]|nr:uroporphyrinogen-III synthase [Paracoccaceae bacterium]